MHTAARSADDTASWQDPQFNLLATLTVDGGSGGGTGAATAGATASGGAAAAAPLLDLVACRLLLRTGRVEPSGGRWVGRVGDPR